MRTNHINLVKALTLTERIKSNDSNDLNSLGKDFDLELAKFRLNHLTSQTQFVNRKTFDRKLNTQGLNEKSLLYLFAESAESLAGRIGEFPKYVSDLNEILDDYLTKDSAFIRKFIAASPTDLDNFLIFSIPFIVRGFDLLERKLTERDFKDKHNPLAVESRDNLLFSLLLQQIVSITYRVLTLELNVARISGSLKGETANERFDNFVKQLSVSEIRREIINEYPVMARRLVENIKNWVNNSFELIENLINDWSEICTTFGIDERAVVTKISGGNSDFHKKGKSVLILSFSDERKIVYKPRSLALDRHFAELIGYFNDLNSVLYLQPINVIDKGEHGWSELLEYNSCATQEEVKNYYRRLGIYLALFYSFNGTDLHYENIIACGEFPFIIDLEMMLQPKITIDNQEHDISQLATAELLDSVINTGVLPSRIWKHNSSEGVEISGLAGSENQMTPQEVAIWDKIGEDELKLVYKKVALTGKQNRPRLTGAEVRIEDYVEDFLFGFTAMYKTIIENRDVVLSKLENFRRDKIRLVFRPSNTYSLMIKDGYHPDYSRDAVDQDIFFDRLWSGVEQNYLLEKIVGSEQNDVRNGDVPLFEIEVDSKTITDSEGRKIEGIIDNSSYEKAVSRLRKMSLKDLSFQKWITEASLTALHLGNNPDNWGKSSHPQSKKDFELDDFLEEAMKIGNKIEQTAIRNEDFVDWLGINLVNNKFWNILPMGLDLYSGLPGTGLFISYLSHLSQKDKYYFLSEKILRTINHRISLLLRNLRKKNYTGLTSGEVVGIFNGLSGYLYYLSRLAQINENYEIQLADEVIELIEKYVYSDKYYDIISGNAGCILSLINLWQATGSETAIKAASQCGNYLIAKVSDENGNLFWKSEHNISSGFSHGNMGIASALLCLAEATNRSVYRKIALKVMNSSLRRHSDNIQKDEWTYTWCHGLIGEGFARIFANKYGDNGGISDLAELAVLVGEDGFGRNHSLCHGDLGSLDFLIESEKILQSTAISRLIKEKSAAILFSMRKEGWICGVPNGIETPGLMVGLSGLGMGLLRIFNHEIVPSVLMLDPFQKTARKIISDSEI